VKLNFSSWGEDITVQLGPDGYLESIKSKCSFPLQLFDWGKNRENVDSLTQELKRLTKKKQSKP